MGILESVRERLETYGSTHLGPVCTVQELEWILAEYERSRAEVARLTAEVEARPAITREDADFLVSYMQIMAIEPNDAYQRWQTLTAVLRAHAKETSR